MKITAFATQGRYNHFGWPTSLRITYKTVMMAQYVDVTSGGTFQVKWFYYHHHARVYCHQSKSQISDPISDSQTYRTF